MLVLDVLRAAGSFPYFFQELSDSKGMSKQYDRYLVNLEQLAVRIGKDPMSVDSQRGARHLVDSLAIALEAHCLLSHGGFFFYTYFLSKPTFIKEILNVSICYIVSQACQKLRNYT